MAWRKYHALLSLSLLAGLAGSRLAWADQKVYPIGHFSDEFRATLSVEDTNDVFRRGSVAVFARRSGQRLLRVDSDELTLEVENGQVAANIQELPYGRQSVLIYEDFDFDGRRDLAIMDGQNSCYHGPSFQIFLRRGSGFEKSATFTELAQDYCGMFTVDARAKRLFNMTKSGCCWHQFDTFNVINHAPHLLESVVESVEPASPVYLSRQKNGAASSTEHFLLPPEDSGRRPLLAFDLVGAGHKRVEVFATDGTVDYALLAGSEHRVDFSYQLNVLSKRGASATDQPFTYDASTAELSFQNGAYRYVIHDGPQAPGVSVHFRGKVVELAGVAESRSGTLRGLRAEDFENVRLTR